MITLKIKNDIKLIVFKQNFIIIYNIMSER